MLLHILLFVYWLGGDLGVYYSSRFILRDDLAPQARATALKIMHGVDLAPRICLVLFLPSGVTLMAAGPLGDEFFVGPVLLTLLWIASGVWLAMAVYDYTRGATRFGRTVQRLDLAVRYGLVAVLLAIAGYTMIATDPFGVDTNPRWLGAKLGAYALCILAGVLIRWRLRGFGPAFGRLMATGSTPQVEHDIRSSLRSCEPYVYSIWALVLLAAVLGVVKPGSTAF
ncbi:UNVERIFIED_CONTAM: hypothetical protein LK11_19495 [Mumia flava]